MSDLSVFVDESGDTGLDSKHYLVTFIFHDQSRSIEPDLAKLGGQLRNLGFPLDRAIHAGPAIRRELEYANMSVVERKRVFTAMFAFAVRCDISYRTFAYRKRELVAREHGGVEGGLRDRLVRDVRLFLRERLAYFSGFDRVVVYYDNGQHVVAAALREAFGTELSRVEFRLAFPHEYRLFQAADLACTLELLRAKADARELSRSELGFFGSAGRLRKNYLRQLSRLRLP